MPKTTLYLVRHGEADESAQDDPGLTELGRRQAAAVGLRLKDIDVPVVHHSSRRRAMETANIIAGRLRAAEAVPSESAEDQTPFPTDWELVPQRYHEFLHQVPNRERDPGGRRLDAAMSELSRIRDVDQSLLVVTHNFVIGWFIRHTLDAPWWRWIGLNQANGGVSVIRWTDSDHPRLVAFNETGHLSEL